MSFSHDHRDDAVYSDDTESVSEMYSGHEQDIPILESYGPPTDDDVVDDDVTRFHSGDPDEEPPFDPYEDYDEPAPDPHDDGDVVELELDADELLTADPGPSPASKKSKTAKKSKQISSDDQEFVDALRRAGLVQDARGRGLLPDSLDPDTGSDLSLVDHLSQTPTRPLPQPIAREADTRDALLEVIGKDRLRFSQQEGQDEGGRWELWDGSRWVHASRETVMTIVESLIHDTNGDIPQRVRPVKRVKLKDSDLHRVNKWVDAGLVEHDADGKSIVIAGTDQVVESYYVPDDDWTSRSLVVNAITNGLARRLVDQRPLDLGDLTLNVGNALIDLDRQKLITEDGRFQVSARTVRRTDLVSKRTFARFDEELLKLGPSEWCPTWTQFVRDVMSVRDPATGQWTRRPEHERVLQKLAGTALLPDTSPQRFGLFYGAHGNNGKSLCADVLREVLGEYGHTLDRAAITQTFGEQHPTNLMGLVGARIATVHEMYEDRWNTTVVKDLVAGPRFNARRIGENEGSYPTSATLIVTTNERPKVLNDTGFWKRVIMLPFDARWSAADDSEDMRAVSIGVEDPNYRSVLLSEADGILLWMLYGLYLYYREGFQLPESLTKTKTRAMSDANDFADFMEEAVEFTGDPKDVIDLKALWTVWKNHMDDVGGKIKGPKSQGELYDSVTHVYARVILRYFGRPGGDRNERKGFGGIRWTELGRGLANAAHVLPKVSAKDAKVDTPTFGNSEG